MQTFSLNKLGGWSISETLLQFILENVPHGSTILELGSGYGTEVLSRTYNMASIEHNSEYVNKYTSKYIHAPLVNYWYDRASIINGLNDVNYDMILIDGPPGDLSKGRIGFVQNLDLFNTDGMLIFDDTNREGEELLFSQVLEMVGEYRQSTHLINNEFSVIYPKSWA